MFLPSAAAPCRCSRRGLQLLRHICCATIHLRSADISVTGSNRVNPEIERDELVAAILRATAEMSTGRAAFTQVVAERFGLAATDVDCLGLLASEGAMAVGRLGELTALTTGATTRMVDRLEQAGYVRRVPDPADRRRVIVEPVAERTIAVARAFEPLDAAIRAALSLPRPPMPLAIRAFLDTTVAGSRDAIAQARAPEAAGVAASHAGSPEPSSASAPVASATHGRLVFVTAVPNVKITTDPRSGGTSTGHASPGRCPAHGSATA